MPKGTEADEKTVKSVVTAPAASQAPETAADKRAEEADLNQEVGVPSSDATGDPGPCVDESAHDRPPSAADH